VLCLSAAPTAKTLAAFLSIAALLTAGGGMPGGLPSALPSNRPFVGHLDSFFLKFEIREAANDERTGKDGVQGDEKGRQGRSL
jgi:hypothetical protein